MFKIPNFSLAPRLCKQAGLDLVVCVIRSRSPYTCIRDSTGDLCHFDMTVRCAAHNAGATLMHLPDWCFVCHIFLTKTPRSADPRIFEEFEWVPQRIWIWSWFRWIRFTPSANHNESVWPWNWPWNRECLKYALAIWSCNEKHKLISYFQLGSSSFSLTPHFKSNKYTCTICQQRWRNV